LFAFGLLNPTFVKEALDQVQFYSAVSLFALRYGTFQTSSKLQAPSFFSMSALHESSSTDANGSNIDCASMPMSNAKVSLKNGMLPESVSMPLSDVDLF
jgi:hypothetical protein